MAKEMPTYQELQQELEKCRNTLAHFQSNYKEVQSLTQTGHWELDVVSGTLFWSDEIYRIFGCQPQEFGATYEAFLSFIHPDDRELVNKAYQEHIQKRAPYDIEHRILLKNGEVRQVRKKCTTFYAEDGKPLRSVGTVTDITQRVQLMEELGSTLTQVEDSRAQLKALINTLPDLVWFKEPNGAYLSCNHHFEAFYGAKEADIVGKTDYDFTSKESADIFHQNDLAAMQAQKPMYFEEQVVFSSSQQQETVESLKMPVYNQHNQLIGVLGICRDFAKRKEVEADFNHFFELIPDLVAIGSAKGYITHMNRAWETTLGFTQEELKSVPFIQLVHPDDLKRSFREYKSQMGQRSSARFSNRFRCKNGEYRWMDWSLIQTPDGKSIYAAARDITEKKQTEAELELSKGKIWETEQRYQKMFANMQSGVLVFKPIDDNSNFVFVDFNAAARKFLKISWNMVRERSLLEIMPIISKTPLLKAMQKANKTGKTQVVSAFYFKDDIREGWPESHIYKLPTGEVVAIFDDVTERKNAEIQMQKQNDELRVAKEIAEASQKMYKAIADTSPLALYISKGVDQILDYINPTFSNLFGYQFEEVAEISLWWPRAYPEEEYRKQISEEWNRRVAIAIDNRSYIEPMETVVTCKDGSHKNVLWGFVSTGVNNWTFGTDLTSYREFEQELIKAREKAEEGSRLKTAFLHNMSHEIRTPLNAITGFANLLEKPNLSEEKQKSYVHIIQNSSSQLLSIVSDILTISSLETKQEQMNVSEVCINCVVLELLAIFRQQAAKQNISLFAKQPLSDAQSQILTDQTKITQILSNLLSNAIKFTREGHIEFGYVLKGNELVFYVKDSGIGIKPEYHNSIFERFHKTEKPEGTLYSGTGLGLSISKGFVELLGGNIWVESEFGKGSSFFFTIPYRPTNNKPWKGNVSSGMEPEATILVAEDEEFNYLFLEEVLRCAGLTIIHAKNGKESVELFEATPKIDLILMDVKMPIMSGYEAAKIIKAKKNRCPIIAQSAYALEHERGLIENVFDDYLTKPIDIQNLKDTISKYINIKWD